MRLSTPCSRIKSSAGEIFSSSFSFFSAEDHAKRAPGRTSPAPAPGARKAKSRRVTRLTTSIVSFQSDSVIGAEVVSLLRSWINAQYLHKISHFPQVSQGVTGRFVVPSQDVHVEDILPRPSPHRTGFDLAQTDVAKRKDAQLF